MVNYCVCGGCTNSSVSGHRVHTFPNRNKNGPIFRAWVRFVKMKRRDFAAASATKNAVICGAHFKPEDYNPSDMMEFNMGYRSKDQVRLKTGVVPSVHSAKLRPASGAGARGRHGHRSKRSSAPRRQDLSVCHKQQLVQQPLQELEGQELERAKKTTRLDHYYATSAPTGAISKVAETIQDPEAKLESEAIPSPIMISQFSVSDAQIRLYTKLPSVCVFKIFWEHIAPSASRLIYWSKARRMGEEAMGDTGPSPSHSMPLINEFLMYSMRIAAGMKEQLLADMFQFNVATVSRVIITWANYLFLILGTLPIWMSREKIRSDMPEKFKKHYPKVRVILDCTEIAVTAPSSLTLQSDKFSHNKNRTTMKALIGVTPHGFVSFFSQLYSGCISDEEITRLCGILQLLEPGDEVMADNNFVIDDLLSDVGAKLVIPPFKHSAQFSEEDTEKTQAIVRLRIVLERVIGRIKSNHIWDSPIPLALIGTVSQIWYNCCMMVNFQGPLSCEEYFAHTV